MNKQATWGLIGSTFLLFACGGQRGEKKWVIPETTDQTAPMFLEAPKVVGISSHNAALTMVVNEKIVGSYVLNVGTNFGLTSEQIFNHSEQKNFSSKAMETIRLELEKLQPNTTYEISVTLRDSNGNLLPQAISLTFHTDSDIERQSLSGAPDSAYQGHLWRFEPNGLARHCRLEIVSAPSWMKISDDKRAVQGSFWESAENSSAFTLTSRGENCPKDTSFTVHLHSDPLFRYQWHLHSGGNSQSFSWFHTRPLQGANLLLDSPRLTGLGQHVLIVDSGLQINHPDLKANIDLERNFNLDPLLSSNCQVCDPKDPSPPQITGQEGDQGTAVAGIIAAKAWNQIGIRGIAPDVKISSYNLSAPRFQTSSNDYLRIFTFATDVVCHSGYSSDELLDQISDVDFNSYDNAQKAHVTYGRNEFGTIQVKAAGDVSNRGIDANLDPTNTTAWNMVVGSYNSQGQKSYHANSGSNLWISAPGGERGYQADFSEFPSTTPSIDFYASHTTTDAFHEETPCSMGYAKDPSHFPSPQEAAFFSLGLGSGFNLGWHDLNPNCQYTAHMAQTPAAAAVVSAAAAKILQRKPDITWRQMRYLLARSAKPIDIDHPGERTTIGNTLFERTLPWITNAAGFRFHNWYGFGALDFTSAIEILNDLELKPLPPLFDSGFQLAGSPNAIIPINSVAGVSKDFYQYRDIIIESVQLQVSITHPKASALSIALVSPQGTKSILKPVNDGTTYANLHGKTYLTNAFYGERAKGKWIIKVVDGKPSSQAGTFANWYLRFTGHKDHGDSFAKVSTQLMETKLK